MIYLLIECAGDYEDYREYPVAYFTNRQEAEAKLLEFNTKLKEIKDKNRKLQYYDLSIDDSHEFFINEVELFTDKHYPNILSDEYWDAVVEYDRKWYRDEPTVEQDEG